MIEVAGLWLLRPLWLLGVPLVALAVWWWRHQRGLSRWRRIFDPKLVPALERLGHIIPSSGAGVAASLASVAAIIALALAGPATRNASAPAFRNLDVVFLLIDLSDSVTKGGGLDDARAAAARVLSEASGRPVALAVFAGETYLVSGPTEDPQTLGTAIAVMDADTMPDKGSRPDRALRFVHARLAEASALGADVVLVSDGGGVGPEALQEAKSLHADGALVSALFVEPAKEPYGMPPASRAGLQALARAGGGVVADASRPDAVLAQLQDNAGAAARDDRLAPLLFADRGRLVLVLALVPALLLIRRRGSTP
jgi:Ca-activated chloride channel family protein